MSKLKEKIKEFIPNTVRSIMTTVYDQTKALEDKGDRVAKESPFVTIKIGHEGDEWVLKVRWPISKTIAYIKINKDNWEMVVRRRTNNVVSNIEDLYPVINKDKDFGIETFTGSFITEDYLQTQKDEEIIWAPSIKAKNMELKKNHETGNVYLIDSDLEDTVKHPPESVLVTDKIVLVETISSDTDNITLNEFLTETGYKDLNDVLMLGKLPKTGREVKIYCISGAIYYTVIQDTLPNDIVEKSYIVSNMEGDWTILHWRIMQNITVSHEKLEVVSVNSYA
jgi:hypothetical protein